MGTFTERGMAVQLPSLVGDKLHLFPDKGFYRSRGRVPQEMNELDGQSTETKARLPQGD